MKIIFTFLTYLLLLSGYCSAEQEPFPSPSSPFPLEGNEDHFTRDFIQMLITLGVIVAIIFFISWLLKKILHTRIQQMNVSSEIKILERRSLTPKTTLYLLEIKGKGLVVSESANGLTHLSDFAIDHQQDEI